MGLPVELRLQIYILVRGPVELVEEGRYLDNIAAPRTSKRVLALLAVNKQIRAEAEDVICQTMEVGPRFAGIPQSTALQIRKVLLLCDRDESFWFCEPGNPPEPEFALRTLCYNCGPSQDYAYHSRRTTLVSMWTYFCKHYPLITEVRLRIDHKGKDTRAPSRHQLPFSFADSSSKARSSLWGVSFLPKLERVVVESYPSDSETEFSKRAIGLFESIKGELEAVGSGAVVEQRLVEAQ